MPMLMLITGVWHIVAALIIELLGGFWGENLSIFYSSLLFFPQKFDPSDKATLPNFKAKHRCPERMQSQDQCVVAIKQNAHSEISDPSGYQTFTAQLRFLNMPKTTTLLCKRLNRSLENPSKARTHVMYGRGGVSDDLIHHKDQRERHVIGSITELLLQGHAIPECAIRSQVMLNRSSQQRPLQSNILVACFVTNGLEL
jgi:hypothetical protein